MLDDNGKTIKHQAGKSDYRNNGNFDRGHLIPSSYGFNKTDKISTFTLTNIVPQAATFNKGSWNRMENCIKCVMDKYCINNNGITEGFVVTGAQSSFNNTLNHKINIPSMLWSAFCCYSSTMNMWLASAHWGTNVSDKSKKKYLQTKTLAELHNKLGTTDSEFNVFPRTRCPLHGTIARFYPEDKNCQCPSSALTTSASGTSTITSHLLTTKSDSMISRSSSPESTSSDTDVTSDSYKTTPDLIPTVSIFSPSTSGPVITTSASGSDTSSSVPSTTETYHYDPL